MHRTGSADVRTARAVDDGRTCAAAWIGRSTRTCPAGLPAAEDAALLEENLHLIEDRSDRFVNYFYATLFLESPDLRSLFPAAMDAQRDRLFRALLGAVRNLGAVESFAPMLAQLGRDHRKFGVRNADYDAFGRALITALERYSEDVWVPELEDAWVRAYAYVANAMIDGANEAAAAEPAWWRAEIVAHERRAEDIAVIIVRPDAPYPYRAGQFTSIETPYRPRSWRHYSMATAESPDGLVEFHVRTVGAGFVSGPLVWSAAAGDALKLGAPMGDMAIDKESPARRAVHRRGHRPGADQGDGRRDDTLEHRSPGHRVLRRPAGRRSLRHGRAASPRCAEPLADSGALRVRRPRVHR